MHDEKVGVPTKIINNYCWIMNTFSLPDHYSGEKNVDFIHHGVGEIIHFHPIQILSNTT